MKRQATVKPTVLKDIVRRVARVARPQKIILFGSAARGEMGANSDVDLLVIKAGRFNRGSLTEEIYAGLRGAAAAVDVVLVTPADVEQNRDFPALVIAPALKEGIVVYGA